MKHRTVYIAGPMTGYVDFNYPAFHRAAELLRGTGKWLVLNPAESFEGRQDLEYETYIVSALKQIDQADVICLLPGWEESKGAKLERVYAQAAGKRIWEAHRGWKDTFRGEELQGVRLPAYPPKPPEFLNGLKAEWTWPQGQKLWTTPEKDVPEKKSILTEAEELIHGDRQKDYGPPKENFARIAKTWEAVFDHEVTPVQVALCMIGLKIARHKHSPKRDNIVDLAGYAGLLELLDE